MKAGVNNSNQSIYYFTASHHELLCDPARLVFINELLPSLCCAASPAGLNGYILLTSFPSSTINMTCSERATRGAKVQAKIKGKGLMMKGRRRANIIIAEGEQSSEKQTLVSILPCASGCDLKAGAKQEKKKKTGLQYLRKWSLSFDLHPLQGPNYNPSIQAQTLDIPESASELGNHVKRVKCEISGLTAPKPTGSTSASCSLTPFQYVHSQQLRRNTFVLIICRLTRVNPLKTRSLKKKKQQNSF